MVQAYNPNTKQAEAEGSHIQRLNEFQSKLKASLDNSERLPFQNEKVRMKLRVWVGGREFA